MTEIKKCQRCGIVIGDAYNTDYYAYIRMNYCDECRRYVTNMQAAERMRNMRRRTRAINKARKENLELLEEYFCLTHLQSLLPSHRNPAY